MIDYSRFQLANGLTVLVHPDPTTPMAVVNILYKVGARDEQPDKTGFAHLFEHLMFGGSVNVPIFDGPLQMAGGENNAFTNNDVTNYYDILPANNLETAFWLESDRMLNLDFSQRSLDVQKKVVSEEFKENYLNQPYGEVWHLLREMAYTTHPYRWPTIGLELSHIEQAALEDVKAFFYRYYRPNNAILVVGGNVTEDHVRTLAEKWFGDIPAGEAFDRNIPQEPAQTAPRRATKHADIPVNAIYKGYHMASRTEQDYYTADLISDVFSNGTSSRFHQRLIKEQQLFVDVDAYITGSFDKGLFMVEGKMAPGVSPEQAETAITKELNELCKTPLTEEELHKVKNKAESYLVFTEVNLLNRAIHLAFSESLGNANMVNTEVEDYLAVQVEDVQRVAQTMFQEKNSNTLYYLAENQ